MCGTESVTADNTRKTCCYCNGSTQAGLAKCTWGITRCSRSRSELEASGAQRGCWDLGYKMYVFQWQSQMFICRGVSEGGPANSLIQVGSYLFARISADGKDSRFDDIRQSPPKFLGAFFAQATWVSLCLMPVLAINSLPASLFASLPAAVGLTDILGLLLYVGGITFEVAADRQKNQWVQEKKEKKHDEDFLTRGLWSKSRHPNYFGEATLWTGIATMSAGVLTTNIAQVGMGLASWGLGGKLTAAAMAGVSPAFVSFLLLKVSGVPMSEGKYDQRYGDRPDYKKWKEETPMFVPKL